MTDAAAAGVAAGAPLPPDVGRLVEHLFRRHAGRMTATLVRVLGPSQLALAEDAVQDALVQALRQWPFRGIPDDPEGWLTRVARNRALDLVRRDRRLARVEAELQRLADHPVDADAPALADDELRLLVACCHPDVPRDGAVALALVALGGFGAREVARLFLVEERTMAQRLVRARRRLRGLGDAALAVPHDGPPLGERREAVLATLYLLFDEGYAAHAGDLLVRRELCEEALRLARLVADHPATRAPACDALVALMALQAARLPARVDANGEPVLLAEQDRTRWDRALVAEGVARLARSARGDERTAYHLQAEIAACHTLASSWERTNWSHLVALYDLLLRREPSLVVGVNRAVALAELEGAAAGLRALEGLDADARSARYVWYFLVRADLLRRAGDLAGARRDRSRALALGISAPARRWLERREDTA